MRRQNFHAGTFTFIFLPPKRRSRIKIVYYDGLGRLVRLVPLGGSMFTVWGKS
ncbi:MAG: hypothetical protein LBG58_10690 [Planctomycetaceae bacterium]|nr:hypothetical protein [Planctomycetaceae bacterium]